MVVSGGGPYVVLDDYLISHYDLATLLQHSPANLLLSQLLSQDHFLADRISRAEDIQVTYSGWLYYLHIASIVMCVCRYSTEADSMFLLLLVLGYHLGFFLSLNYFPRFFSTVAIWLSPMAWAAACILAAMCREVDSYYELLVLHAGVSYARRVATGVIVFEQRIRRSRLHYWTCRLYSLLSGLLIVVVCRWSPFLSDRFLDGMSGSQVLAAVVMAGATHIAWYSLISYAYHMVVWQEHMRDGVAIWVVRHGTVCAKLY